MARPSGSDRARLAEVVLSRRAFSAALLSTAVLGALTACGTDTPAAQPTTTGNTPGTTPASSATGSTTAASTSATATASSVAAPAFPVSISHKYGSTEIAAAPTRVVSVGVTEQDFLLALGVVPVGITDWYGDQPSATWPWAQPLLGDAKPTVLSDADGIQFLEIAKLKPDLIVGLNSGMSEGDYAKLAEIAPTIATPAEAEEEFFDSWPVYLKTIGAALGKTAEATALETSIRDQFAAAAAAHPDFAGKKVIFLQNAVYDGNFIASQQGLGTDFLTDLGFVVPPELDEFVPAEGGQALIPSERIDVLNVADYLVWGTEKDEDRTALEKLPGFADVTAVKNGKSFYTGGVLAGAIYFSSPPSLTYILENLVPLLEGKS